MLNGADVTVAGQENLHFYILPHFECNRQPITVRWRYPQRGRVNIS